MGLKEFFLTVNSEPIGIFVALARSVKDGAGITEQLLFDKVVLNMNSDNFSLQLCTCTLIMFNLSQKGVSVRDRIRAGNLR